MTLAETLPTLASFGAIGAVAVKAPELLKEIYGDLAKPGVLQVGKALETVLSLGNNLLLPIRLLNETSRSFEQKKFEEIAQRFNAIPIEDIVEVRPEIGTPILEKLSYTDDPVLREMFIELLAQASDKKKINQAHPAFVGIIQNITPDEAILLKHLKSSKSFPYMWVWEKASDEGSYRKLLDFIMDIPDEMIFPSNIPIYLSNLTGLGLIETDEGKFSPDLNAYEEIFNHIKSNIPNVQAGEQFELGVKRPVGSIIASKGLITVLPFGRAFQSACITE